MNRHRRLLALSTVAFLVCDTAAMADGPAAPSLTLELGRGATVVLERAFKTVLIGNPEVVDVQTQDQRSVLLKTVGPGATNLVFIDEEGAVIRNVRILVRNGRGI